MKATIKLEYIGEAQDARLSMYGKMIDQVSDGLGKKVIGNTRLIFIELMLAFNQNKSIILFIS